MCWSKIVIVLLGVITAIQGYGQDNYSSVQLVDKQATQETKALFINLQQLAPKGILFGHQESLAYGVEWKKEKGRSDVKDVCGSYPAVYGWDIGKIGSPKNIDGVLYKDMIRWNKEAFQRGGMNTYSWHMDNPTSGGNSWDTTRTVADIIPGGSKHEFYKKKLDKIARFFKKLKVGKKPIPIVFRPFHEHTGSWFWWGKRHTTPEEFVKLWRFTVEYLRDEKNLHNLLYAYSTDIFSTKEQFMHFYPGDAYVDIVGFDDYYDFIRNDIKGFVKQLKSVVEIAEERNKIAALTETGSEAIPSKNWWTDVLLKNIKADATGSRIAWILAWRNANPSHHYVPYNKEHISAEDFIKFRKDPFTFFEDDLPDLYKLPKKTNN